MILGRRFEDALQCMVHVHTDQVRKGTSIPYVSHLLMVTAIALEHGADEDEAIAALLHDAVEDTDTTLEDIQSRLGTRVSGIVKACTDTDETPKPPWLARKKTYLDHLRSEKDPSVFLVSGADKVANVRAILNDYRDIGEALWSRFNGGREGTLWYYRALADLFAERRPSPLSDELNRLVSQLETLTTANISVSTDTRPQIVDAHKKSELYSSLWQSCDELRDGMDASQYKRDRERDIALEAEENPSRRLP